MVGPRRMMQAAGSLVLFVLYFFIGYVTISKALVWGGIADLVSSRPERYITPVSIRKAPVRSSGACFTL